MNTVLIITDDADDATILGDTLRGARDGPFVTACVQSLAESLVRLKQGGVDIILVDLFLPDRNGIDSFDVLFKLVPPIPIKILSHEDDEDIAVEAVQRGAQGFLLKGYFQMRSCPRRYAMSYSANG